jgi:hypothetical protein
LYDELRKALDEKVSTESSLHAKISKLSLKNDCLRVELQKLINTKLIMHVDSEIN